MKRRNLTLLLLSIGTLVFMGCSQQAEKQKPPTEHKIAADPRGTTEEQIAHHKQQIQRYEVAVARQEQAAQRARDRGNMVEVRQAEARKEQYERKIERHQQEVERLEATEKWK